MLEIWFLNIEEHVSIFCSVKCNLWVVEVGLTFVPEDHVVSSTEPPCQESPNAVPK